MQGNKMNYVRVTFIWAAVVVVIVVLYFNLVSVSSLFSVVNRKFYDTIAQKTLLETTSTKCTTLADLPIPSARGIINYSTLCATLYSDLGYRPCKNSALSLWQELWKPINCTKTFATFLEIAALPSSPSQPARDIPSALYDNFTLHGHVKVMPFYFNDATSFNSLTVWSNATMTQYFQLVKNKYAFYEGDAFDLTAAMEMYKDVMKNARVLVIGSLNPWVEAIAFTWGAATIVTVEYAQIRSDYANLTIVHPVKMSQTWEDYAELFDVAISFSSIEHAGLGRFTDALCADCDLMEMEKTACLVKPGGLFFLTLPVGKDVIMFNAHRVYGLLRLPVMNSNWKLIDFFWKKKSIKEYGTKYLQNVLLLNNATLGALVQPVIVLENRKDKNCD